MGDPNVGDFVGWCVWFPGPDIDYALCIERDGSRALLRFQVYQTPGPWHESWETVASYSKYGCWKTERLDKIGESLRLERQRLFPHLS